MRGVLVLGLVVGCSSDTITIEVSRPPDTEVKMVELFIGRGPICTTLDSNGNVVDCPGIGPPDTNATRSETDGEVYFIDNVRPFISKVDADGIARFSIDPSREQLPVLIAVGTDANGTENSVAIMKALSLDRGALRVEVQLEPAGDALTKDTVPLPDVIHVDVWPDASPFRQPVDTCVGAEFKGRRVFVVPEGDHDCDVVAVENECKEFVHLAEESEKDVDAGNVVCSFPSAIGTTPVCRLGAETCDEGAGGGIGCANSREVCISDVICGACQDLDQPCIRKALVDEGSKVSAIKCKIQLLTDQGDGHLRPCAQRIPTPLQLPGTCLDSSLSKLEFPFEFTDLELVISTGPAAGEQIRLDTLPPSSSVCSFDLGHTGRFPASGTPPELVPLWAKFLVDANRDVLLPVSLEFELVPVGESCDTVGTGCVFVPVNVDSAGQCLSADL